MSAAVPRSARLRPAAVSRGTAAALRTGRLRLEALSRTLDCAVVISADLLARLPARPAAVVPRSRGNHALKGRGAMRGVRGLERGAVAPVAA